MTTTSGAHHHLYSSDTGEDLGPATDEQIAASDAAAEKDGGRGAFLIDADGNPLDPRDNAAVRNVYTA